MLATTLCVAQTTDDEKQASRKRNFAEFLMYWTEWNAYIDISQLEKRRAERDIYEDAINKIPDLVRDSTYYANTITDNAGIINKKYNVNERPDMAFTMYEARQMYKYKKADKNSDEYILGKNLHEYEQILKELKLARYTVQVHKK